MHGKLILVPFNAALEGVKAVSQDAAGSGTVCTIERANRVYSFSIHPPQKPSATNRDAAFIPFWWVSHTSDKQKANMKKVIMVHDDVNIPVYVNAMGEIKKGEHVCLYKKKPIVVNTAKPYAVEFVTGTVVAPPAKVARRK